MQEAADIIHAIDPDVAPSNIRWPIVYELIGLGYMIPSHIDLQPTEPPLVSDQFDHIKVQSRLASLFAGMVEQESKLDQNQGKTMAELGLIVACKLSNQQD